MFKLICFLFLALFNNEEYPQVESQFINSTITLNNKRFIKFDNSGLVIDYESKKVFIYCVKTTNLLLCETSTITSIKDVNYLNWDNSESIQTSSNKTIIIKYALTDKSLGLGYVESYIIK